jgi:hypothetical protein
MPICSHSFYSACSGMYLNKIALQKLQKTGVVRTSHRQTTLRYTLGKHCKLFQPNLLLVSLFAVNDVEFCFRQLARRGVKEAMIVVQSEMKKRKLR